MISESVDSTILRISVMLWQAFIIRQFYIKCLDNTQLLFVCQYHDSIFSLGTRQYKGIIQLNIKSTLVLKIISECTLNYKSVLIFFTRRIRGIRLFLKGLDQYCSKAILLKNTFDCLFILPSLRKTGYLSDTTLRKLKIVY